MYRPPSSGEKDLLELQATLMSIPRNTPFVLCGDFNAPHVDWTSRTVEASAPLEDLLCEVSLDSGLDQLVKHPTRGGNILDLVFSNSNVSVDDVEVVDSIPGADHDAVHFSLAGKTPPVSPTCRRTVYNFKKADFPKFRSIINNTHWDSIFITKDINSIWDKWKELFFAAADASIPKVFVKCKKRTDWLTKETRSEIKKKRRLYRMMKRSKKERDVETYKRQSNKVRYLTRRDHTQHLQRITLNLRSNPRPFWRWLKSTRNGKTTIPDISNPDGTNAATSVLQKATIFNNYFSTVFTQEDSSNIPVLEEELKSNSNPTTIEDLDFNSADVLEELSNINVNKCGGPDGIPAILLKEGAQPIAPILTRVLNVSLEVGSLPRDWTRANVTPIHKKGDRHNPNNYRPISLTGHVVKMAERIIASKIRQFISPMITPVQHGFRPNHSCLTQLLQTIHYLAESLDKGLSSHVTFLDFSKAFDSVPHQRLLLI